MIRKWFEELTSCVDYVIRYLSSRYLTYVYFRSKLDFLSEFVGGCRIFYHVDPGVRIDYDVIDSSSDTFRPSNFNELTSSPNLKSTR